jgi:hypothetical protein
MSSKFSGKKCNKILEKAIFSIAEQQFWQIRSVSTGYIRIISMENSDPVTDPTSWKIWGWKSRDTVPFSIQNGVGFWTQDRIHSKFADQDLENIWIALDLDSQHCKP